MSTTSPSVFFFNVACGKLHLLATGITKHQLVMVQKDTFFFTEKENTRFSACIYSLRSGSS